MSREFEKVIVDGIIIDAYESEIKKLKNTCYGLSNENHDLRQQVEYMGEWEDKALDLIGKLFTENAHLIQELEKIKEVFK